MEGQVAGSRAARSILQSTATVDDAARPGVHDQGDVVEARSNRDLRDVVRAPAQKELRS